MRTSAWILIGAALLPLALYPTAGAEPQESVMLHVRKDGEQYSYIPARVEVYPGAEVTLGHIFARHSIVAVDGSFNSTGDASEWPRFRAPSEPGEYPFYCWIHATPGTTPDEGMAGVLVVVPRPGAPSAEAAQDDAFPAEPQEARDVPAPALAGLVGAAAVALLLRRRRA